MGSGCTVERQATCEVDLFPGEKYIVVPCTTTAKFMQQAKKTQPTPVRLLNEGGVAFTRAGDKCVQEVFERLNMDMDGYLSRKEIIRFLKATQPQMESEQYRAKSKKVLRHFDSTRTGLTLKGFRLALLSSEAYGLRPGMTRDERENALMRDLISLGYDENLNLVGSRGCVISVHSEAPVVMKTQPFTQNIYDEAMELPILAEGKKTDYENGGFTVYNKYNGFAGMSILVANNKEETNLKITMTVSGENVISHRGMLAYTATVPPMEACVLHHLAPAVEPGAWSCKFSLTYLREKAIST